MTSRPFLALVDYPFYVVTARSPDGDMSGCLAGFVTQCSIDPPNFLVCISKRNHTLPVAERATGMGLHLLGEDQEDMARLFGEETGDLVDKFAAVDWRLGSTGAPLLVESAVVPRGPDSRSLLASATTRASCCAACARWRAATTGLLTYRGTPPLEPGHPA